MGGELGVDKVDVADLSVHSRGGKSVVDNVGAAEDVADDVMAENPVSWEYTVLRTSPELNVIVTSGIGGRAFDSSSVVSEPSDRAVITKSTAFAVALPS